MNRQEILRKAAVFCQWNPDHPDNKYSEGNLSSLNPPVNVQNGEAKAVFIEAIKGTELESALVDASEFARLSDVIEHMPLINLLLWADERTRGKDLVAIVRKGLTPVHKYRYPFESGKVFVEQRFVCIKESKH